MEFKDKLKQLRTEKGISQYKLAQDINISRSVIAKWEIGLSIPSKDNLVVLAKYFNIPEENLISNYEVTEQMTEKNSKINKLKKIIIALCGALAICMIFIAIFINSIPIPRSGGTITFSAERVSTKPQTTERTISIQGHEFFYYNVYNDGHGNFVLKDETSYIRNYDLQFGVRFKHLSCVAIYDISESLDNKKALSPIATNYENGDYGYQVYFGFEIKINDSSYTDINIGKISHWC